MKFTVKENIPASDIKKYLPKKFAALTGKFIDDEAVNLIVFHDDRKNTITARNAEKAISRITDKTLVTYCYGSQFTLDAQDIISANNGRVYYLFGNAVWNDKSLFKFKNGEIL